MVLAVLLISVDLVGAAEEVSVFFVVGVLKIGFLVVVLSIVGLIITARSDRRDRVGVALVVRAVVDVVTVVGAAVVVLETRGTLVVVRYELFGPAANAASGTPIGSPARIGGIWNPIARANPLASTAICRQWPLSAFMRRSAAPAPANVFRASIPERDQSRADSAP